MSCSVFESGTPAVERAYPTRVGAYRFGEFRLDMAREILTGPSGALVLRRKVFGTLQVLLDAAPAVVGLDELLERVWGRHVISASAVPNAIAELRRAIGDDAKSPRYIETRHRRGYRLCVRVEREPPGRATIVRGAQAELLALIDSSGVDGAGTPARERLRRLQREAAARGLTFLALQAQFALQACDPAT